MTLSSDASCEGAAKDVTKALAPGLDSEMIEAQMPLQVALIDRTLNRSALRRGRRQREPTVHGAAGTSNSAAGTSAAGRWRRQQGPTAVHAAAGSRGTSAAEESVGAQQLACDLVSQFRAGGQAKSTAIARLLQLTFADKLSSRAAQIALLVLPSAGAEELASGLRGHIREASSAMYAHHVVQRIVEAMPASGSSSVALELLGAGEEMARDRFGCHVLCTLLQNALPNEQPVRLLIDEVMTGAESLCRHQFGSLVMWHILKFGLPGHRHMVVKALCADTYANAANKQGSRLVEAALNFAAPLDQYVVASDVFDCEEELLDLSSDRFGCRVILRILKMLEFQKSAVDILLQEAGSLRCGTKYSRRVLAMVEGLSQ